MENSTTPTATDNQPTATKKCRHCGKVLPITEFYRKSKSKDGLQCVCKECHKAEVAECAAKRKAQTTLPEQHIAPHPIFSKMQPREVIAEVRERINYLRTIGWEGQLKMKFVKVHELTI